MTKRKIYAIDKYGWPVETIKGRWFTNAIRLLLHTRRIGRWSPPVAAPNPFVQQAPRA